MVWLFQEKGKQCSKQINQSKEESKKKKKKQRESQESNENNTVQKNYNTKKTAIQDKNFAAMIHKLKEEKWKKEKRKSIALIIFKIKSVSSSKNGTSSS
jgi:protein required for attachment to host cells